MHLHARSVDENCANIGRGPLYIITKIEVEATMLPKCYFLASKYAQITRLNKAVWKLFTVWWIFTPVQQILTDFERRLLNWWFYNTVKRNKMNFFLQIISLSFWRQNLYLPCTQYMYMYMYVKQMISRTCRHLMLWLIRWHCQFYFAQF